VQGWRFSEFEWWRNPCVGKIRLWRERKELWRVAEDLQLSADKNQSVYFCLDLLEIAIFCPR
jgi:hypothetical protein